MSPASAVLVVVGCSCVTIATHTISTSTNFTGFRGRDHIYLLCCTVHCLPEISLMLIMLVCIHIHVAASISPYLPYSAKVLRHIIFVVFTDSSWTAKIMLTNFFQTSSAYRGCHSTVNCTTTQQNMEHTLDMFFGTRLTVSPLPRRRDPCGSHSLLHEGSCIPAVLVHVVPTSHRLNAEHFGCHTRPRTNNCAPGGGRIRLGVANQNPQFVKVISAKFANPQKFVPQKFGAIRYIPLIMGCETQMYNFVCKYTIEHLKVKG